MSDRQQLSIEDARYNAFDASIGRHVITRWFIKHGLRLLMACYLGIMHIAKLIGPAKRPVGNDGFDILITGTFYSDNWLISHLRPLSMSRYCHRIWMVATSPVPKIDTVEAVYPPKWLIRVTGGSSARLLTFIWFALNKHPHIVGGFHILVNGLVAALSARLTGARSLYICGGGPREVLGGGYSTENLLFSKLEKPDAVIERLLLKAVSAFDLVITMGSTAVEFFRQRGVRATCRIVPGGFDGNRFSPSRTSPVNDLILVGRLSPVKRVDLFLKAIKQVRDALPDVKAVVVGDGPLRSSLEQSAHELGIEHNVKFLGRQVHVERWLKQSRIFVLTSDSEGLSLAMMEAMLCGLPAVVTNVGDLGDMVKNGVNGHLISDHTPEAFAECIITLLTDTSRLNNFSHAARMSAERYKTANTSLLWDDILGKL